MMQMYKVFVNDKPIIFTDSLKKENNFSKYFFKNITLEEVITQLQESNIEGIYLYTNYLEEDWRRFLSRFKVVSAGGGLVVNKRNEILFIYRDHKWDLPKGRIEIGETIENTALREVEEECGISNLVINKFLITTYHYFYQNKEKRLKETKWFLMNSDFEGKLVPQLEEGITKAIFKNKIEVVKALKNSYANILLVYNEFERTK
jgi:hypothetical protein